MTLKLAEVPAPSPPQQPEPPPSPAPQPDPKGPETPDGPIWFEAFGRRVLYRNIWLVEQP